MRHRIAGRQLGRTSEHRLAMRRNMAASLFEHETISTTMEKAKEVRPFAEKLITLAKKGTLAARRQAISLLGNRDIIEYEGDEAVRKGTIIGKLFSELGPRYLERPGGYTRIIRLSMRRLGDNGKLVLLQLIGPDERVERRARAVVKEEEAEGTAAETVEEDVKVGKEPAVEEEGAGQTKAGGGEEEQRQQKD